MATAKRMKYLVDPPVQWAIGRRILLQWAAFAVCLLMVNVILRTMTEMIVTPFREAFVNSLTSQISVLVILASMLPMLVLDTVKFTNRFAGPMYRLKNAIRCVRHDAAPAPLVFRGGDFWQEVTADFNALSGDIQSLRHRNAALENELRALKRDRESQPV